MTSLLLVCELFFFANPKEQKQARFIASCLLEVKFLRFVGIHVLDRERNTSLDGLIDV
jgi:hypothetical protein